MIRTVVFDTKSYDREALDQASAGAGIDWRFMDYRLSAETAQVAKGAAAVCIFVNDHADRPCLEALKELGMLVGSGKLRPRESVAQGIEAAPEAFLGMLKGRNFGKQLVKLI